MRFRLLIFGLMATLLIGCSLYDERDECCAQITFHFQEMISGSDCFNNDIYSLRHFLYDAEGQFLKEVYSDHDDMQNLRLNELQDGNYTLVTLANSSEEHTLIETATSLDKMRVSLIGENEDGSFQSADQLYWNIQNFMVVKELQQYYKCDLSNIHCHLHVFVKWKYLPSYKGSFVMKLTKVPADYHGGKAYIMTRNIDYYFPMETQRKVYHSIEVKPYNFELDGEFITHRWSDDNIPILQLFNNGEAITGKIYLEKPFKEWMWMPSKQPIQDYWIKLEIDSDGKTYVNRWIPGRILDWEDGGVIGR